MGDARSLAREFAEDFAAHQSRRLAVYGFAALAFAGLVYAATLLPFLGAHSTVLSQPSPLDLALIALTLLAPQVAFVAGMLALVRVVRHRDLTRPPAAESRLVLRRISVATAAGLATMIGVAGLSVIAAVSDQRAALPSALLLTGCALAIVLLLSAMLLAPRAFRVEARQPGPQGWLADDVDVVLPFAHSLPPLMYAAATALTAGIAVWIAGVLQADGIDGALRGAAETVACLLCYAVLAAPLGLRPAKREAV